MYQLRSLAEIIVRQPIDDSGSGIFCGPPTLNSLTRWNSRIYPREDGRRIVCLMGSDLVIGQLRHYGAGETKYLDALQFQNKAFLEQIAPILRTLDLPTGIV